MDSLEYEKLIERVEMKHEETVNNLLQKNMTPRGYKLWIGLKERLPDIWNKPTSSTGKYHQKDDGRVPSIMEHTLEMLRSGIKIMRLLDIKPMTTTCDSFLLSIVLHDSLKYGPDGKSTTNNGYTLRDHDRIAADIFETNRKVFLEILTENETNDLITSIRFHSGRWSTDAPLDFDFRNYNPKVFLVHVLDMLSANNCLK